MSGIKDKSKLSSRENRKTLLSTTVLVFPICCLHFHLDTCCSVFLCSQYNDKFYGLNWVNKIPIAIWDSARALCSQEKVEFWSPLGKTKVSGHLLLGFMEIEVNVVIMIVLCM